MDNISAYPHAHSPAKPSGKTAPWQRSSSHQPTRQPDIISDTRPLISEPPSAKKLPAYNFPSTASFSRKPELKYSLLPSKQSNQPNNNPKYTSTTTFTPIFHMGKAVSTLTHDDISHLKQKTYFDKREIKQWYKGFIRDCPQGYLNKQEFIKIYSQFFPFGDSTEFASYIFKSFDINGDDIVDFNEFIIGLSITSRGTVEEKLDWSFRMYDVRNTGEIHFDDMLLVVTSIYKMIGSMFLNVEGEEQEFSPETKVQKIFAKLDKEGKGFLNRQEFQNACKLDPQTLSALNIYDGLI